MPAVFRYVRGLGVAILSMVAFASAATATVPVGPRLAVVTHDALRGSELITIGPMGGMGRRLIVRLDSERPSWSGDGSLVALAATGEDWDGAVVAIAEEDGSNLRVYRRAFLNADQNPVISPDGRSVAFSRAKLIRVLPGRENYLFKSSIWSLDVETGKVKQRTRWIGTGITPSSYSPDGSKLALTVFTHRGLQAFAVDLRNGRLSLLAREASEPVYSPDGSEVAFVRWKNWRASGIDDGSPPINELRLMRVGTFPRSRPLLRSRKLLAWPSWDPSGDRLAFTLSDVVENGYSTPEQGDKVMTINTDGTCLTRAFTDPDLILYGAAWQPGIGRGAGPISC